uniref:Uncharacterized protein n=1 Tax=Oryza glumipatula TaxID=40148 RepID=A0A0E0AIR9_9ORYZ
MASPSFPGACTDLRIPDSPSPVPSPSPSSSFPRPRSPSCALAAFYFPYPRPQSPSHACHNFAPLPCSPSVTNSPLPSLSQQPASSPIAGVLAADGAFSFPLTPGDPIPTSIVFPLLYAAAGPASTTSIAPKHSQGKAFELQICTPSPCDCFPRSCC